MKLINEISRYFLLSSSLIFIVIFIGVYLFLESSLEKEIDEQLSKIYYNVVNELKKGKQVSFYPFVEIDSVNVLSYKKEFKDTQIFSREENESEPFRELISYANIKGKNYKIIVRTSLIEKEDLFATVLTIELFAFVLFIVVLFIINKRLSQKIFSDFYNTLKKIEIFSVKDTSPLIFEKSKIEEFEKLNKAVSFLSEKAITEYRGLKEFSEEMNHEIQTPISVIKSKLELLMQSDELNEDNLKLLDASLKNLSKLERINKSILLLNKLEHKDLFENAELNLSEEIKNVLNDYKDFITTKNLSLNLSIEPDFKIIANQSLINILISNIISNAIKHNVNNGSIDIELKDKKFKISNSVQITDANPEKFFERFFKQSTSSDSVGLGLTIVKKISDLYGFDISNSYTNSTYTLQVNFN